MLTRRTLLTTALAATATGSLADGHMAPLPLFRDFDLGGWRVTTLLAQNRMVENPHDRIFAVNVEAETFAAASTEHFIPSDRFRFFFQPTVINTGSAVVLIDTGTNLEKLKSALAEAGYSPGDVTHVVISHNHYDHIGGFSVRGELTFPDAEFLIGQVEFDHFNGRADKGFNERILPFAERFRFLSPGDEVVSGIWTEAAYGHTPGHLAFRLTNGDKQLMITGDMAVHYIWSLSYPDWQLRFDTDRALAVETRRRILTELAAEKMPFIGYHMPYPGLGFVETRGDGFRFVAHSYQMM